MIVSCFAASTFLVVVDCDKLSQCIQFTPIAMRRTCGDDTPPTLILNMEFQHPDVALGLLRLTAMCTFVVDSIMAQVSQPPSFLMIFGIFLWTLSGGVNYPHACLSHCISIE